MYVVRALEGTPHCQALLRLERRYHSVVFDVQLLLRSRRVLTFDDVICLLPNLFDIPFFDQVTLKQIVRSPDDLRLPLAFFHGEKCGQGIAFYGNGGDRFRKEMADRDEPIEQSVPRDD